MRPLRDLTPGKYHLLTCRTRLSELLFIPHSKLNNCIGSVIAKYSNELNIDLYAAQVLGNHYSSKSSSNFLKPQHNFALNSPITTTCAHYVT